MLWTLAFHGEKINFLEITISLESIYGQMVSENNIWEGFRMIQNVLLSGEAYGREWLEWPQGYLCTSVVPVPAHISCQIRTRRVRYEVSSMWHRAQGCQSYKNKQINHIFRHSSGFEELVGNCDIGNWTHLGHSEKLLINLRVAVLSFRQCICSILQRIFRLCGKQRVV